MTSVSNVSFHKALLMSVYKNTVVTNKVVMQYITGFGVAIIS